MVSKMKVTILLAIVVMILVFVVITGFYNCFFNFNQGSLAPSCMEKVDIQKFFGSIMDSSISQFSEEEPSISEDMHVEENRPVSWKEDSEEFVGKDLYIFYISQIVDQYYPDVDPYIPLAVMEIESDYRPDVKSPAGAVGLMQVIPKYHLHRIEKYGLNDIWDPYANILCGIDLLNEAYQKYGNWSDALYVYNHSKVYVKAVLNKADILRGGNYFGEEASQDPRGS